MPKVLIELDEELYTLLKTRAEKEDRAITQQVRYYIRKGLGNDEPRS